MSMQFEPTTEAGAYAAVLSHLSTAAQYAAALDDLEARLNAVQVRRGELLAAEDAALFDGGDVSAVRSDLRSNSDESAELERAIAGASRRLATAHDTELRAGIEALGEQSRELAAEFTKRWETASKHIAIARREMLAADPLHTKLMANNQAFESARRLDLKINLKTLKREAVGDPGPLPVGVSRAAIDMDHSLREEVHPRHPGRRTPAGAIRNRKGTPL